MIGTRVFKIGKAPLTGEERARQRNLKRCRVYLDQCRRGRLSTNAWNLWLYTQKIDEDVRVSFEELGANREEVRGYLVGFFISLLERVRKIEVSDPKLLYDFIEMELLLEEGIITEEELGTSTEELVNLGAKLELLARLKHIIEES